MPARESDESDPGPEEEVKVGVDLRFWWNGRAIRQITRLWDLTDSLGQTLNAP